MTLRHRFYIQRKRSQTPQSLSSFYGTWRAGVYFNNGPHHAALIRFGQKLYRVPPRLMFIFKPFNKYRHTLKGEWFA